MVGSIVYCAVLCYHPCLFPCFLLFCCSYISIYVCNVLYSCCLLSGGQYRSATSPLFAYRAKPGAGQLSEELLLPACVLFSCCSPLASRLQLLLPGPIAASASTAAPRLPLPRVQLLLPDCGPLQLLLAAFMISCCSRSIASASTAAPRLRPLQLLLARLRPLRLLLPDCIYTGFQHMPGPNVLEHSSRSSRFSK